MLVSSTICYIVQSFSQDLRSFLIQVQVLDELNKRHDRGVSHETMMGSAKRTFSLNENLPSYWHSASETESMHRLDGPHV